MSLVPECPFKSYFGVWFRLLFIFVAGIIPTILFSIFSYMTVEKPAIDARKVFKNKYDK